MRELRVSICFLFLLAACGDEGSNPNLTGMDGGDDADTPSTDAGVDATVALDAGQQDAGPMAPACDPFGGSATACSSGDKCALVRVDGGTGGFYFGCIPIPSSGLKSETAPCTASALDATPAESGDDQVSDNCNVGLACLPLGPGGWKCNRLCLGDSISCGSGGICEFLNLGADAPDLGACSLSSNCDVVYQTGCAAGEGCYVRQTTEGELTGDCAAVVIPDGGTGAPGDPCQFINNCQPGAMCSQQMLADGGAGSALCQELCGLPTTDAGTPDAGGLDAGTLGMATCPGTQVCDPLASMGQTELYPTPAGLCM